MSLFAFVWPAGGGESSGYNDPSVRVLRLFLTRSSRYAVQYRAKRLLEASSEKLGLKGWMQALTEFDARAGFRYSIIAEGGSEKIRTRVLRTVLASEAGCMVETPARAQLTKVNYDFSPAGRDDRGLFRLLLVPRRADGCLVQGLLFLTPDRGELVRLEGHLSKSPSFWVKDVEIVRRYARINEVVLPTRLESIAHVRVAGPSTFTMSYQYETVNGRRVGASPVRP